MQLSKKQCIVTGANTGLGFEVARRLAALGANTTLLCRNKDKGEAAFHRLREEHPGADLEVAVCDLASLAAIRDFITDYSARHEKLDLLYNNAAVMKAKRTVTEDGFEMMFQVNYLAPFLLMTSLLPLLRGGSEPLIINNGRPSARLRLDLEDLQAAKSYRMYRSFFKTKLCLVFATLELARRPERGPVVVAMIDPGTFKSELVRDVRVAAWFKNLFSGSVAKAADNLLHHIGGDPARLNGKVFKERAEQPLPDYWMDEDLGRRMWSMTESMLGVPNAMEGRTAL